MTKTIDIELDEDVLQEVMRRAGTTEPQKALIEAVKEYTKPHNQKEMIRYLGTSEGFYSSAELDELRTTD